MTAVEFQGSPHSVELNKFLQSPAGKEFMLTLHGLRPAYESSQYEHVFIENRGAVRGFEICLRSMVALASPPKVVAQPEANYGVPDRKTSNAETKPE